MKLRSLILFGAGVATGLTIARRLSADDPEIVHGPRRASQTPNPALRTLSTQTQWLSDRATVLSLEAIRRARDAIRNQLGEDGYDEAAWS
jgi:hypothetical protein